MKYIKLFESFQNINQEILNDFNQQQTFKFNNLVYHGTTINHLITILKDGIGTYYHGELNDYFFCVSKNINMIKLAGKSGIEFKANFDNVLNLSDFYYDLLAYETGIEKWWDNDNDNTVEWKAKADKFDLKAWDDYGIDSPSDFLNDYFFNNPKFKDCEGIAIPKSFNYEDSNSEAEIAVTEYGISKLEINRICVDGTWYNPDEISIDELIEEYGYDEDEEFD